MKTCDEKSAPIEDRLAGAIDRICSFVRFDFEFFTKLRAIEGDDIRFNPAEQPLLGFRAEIQFRRNV